MASSKDAASLVLLGLYGFIALRLLLTWLQRRASGAGAALPIACWPRQPSPLEAVHAERYAGFAWCAGFRDIRPYGIASSRNFSPQFLLRLGWCALFNSERWIQPT